jgi:hypothetical protein
MPYFMDSTILFFTYDYFTLKGARISGKITKQGIENASCGISLCFEAPLMQAVDFHLFHPITAE